MAVVDIAGFIAAIKDHAPEHHFHVHDERHFVETYSMRQTFEVDLHPETACGEPLDLHLALEVDPRVVLGFEEHIDGLGEDNDISREFRLPLFFRWGLPALKSPPDLLLLATELAGIGGPDLPLEVSLIDSTAAVTDAPERRLSLVGTTEISLSDLFDHIQPLCDTLDRCHDVSDFLLSRAPGWGWQ